MEKENVKFENILVLLCLAKKIMILLFESLASVENWTLIGQNLQQ